MFQIQDEGAITGPRLLYYTTGMPIAVFSNICIPIGLVNGARYIFVGIVSDHDDMFNL